MALKMRTSGNVASFIDPADNALYYMQYGEDTGAYKAFKATLTTYKDAIIADDIWYVSNYAGPGNTGPTVETIVRSSDN